MEAPDEIPVNLPSGAFVETTPLKKVPFKAVWFGIFKGHDFPFRCDLVGVYCQCVQKKKGITNSLPANRFLFPKHPTDSHFLFFLSEFLHDPRVAVLLIGKNGWMNSKSMGRCSSVGYHLELFQAAAQHEILIHYIHNTRSIRAFSCWNLNSPKLRESLRRVINTIAQFSVVQVVWWTDHLPQINITGDSLLLFGIFNYSPPSPFQLDPILSPSEDTLPLCSQPRAYFYSK